MTELPTNFMDNISQNDEDKASIDNDLREQGTKCIINYDNCTVSIQQHMAPKAVDMDEEEALASVTMHRCDVWLV